jgi:hypothetical protein
MVEKSEFIFFKEVKNCSIHFTNCKSAETQIMRKNDTNTTKAYIKEKEKKKKITQKPPNI